MVYVGGEILFASLVHVSQSTLSARIPVKVVGHKDTRTASLLGAFLSQSSHLLSCGVYLVELENSQLHLLVSVRHSLWRRVHFLLALLATTSQTQHQVQGGLLLDVVVRKSSTILKLLASEDESLLIRWDALLVLDLCLDVLNRVRRLDVERNRLTLLWSVSNFAIRKSIVSYPDVPLGFLRRSKQEG